MPWTLSTTSSTSCAATPERSARGPEQARQRQAPDAAPGVRVHRREAGIDLIEIKRPNRVISATNLWTAGQPLEHGTPLGRFLVRGEPAEVIGARDDAKIGFATGEVGSPRTSYTELIDRVQSIADKAARLIG